MRSGPVWGGAGAGGKMRAFAVRALRLKNVPLLRRGLKRQVIVIYGH